MQGRLHRDSLSFIPLRIHSIRSPFGQEADHGNSGTSRLVHLSPSTDSRPRPLRPFHTRHGFLSRTAQVDCPAQCCGTVAYLTAPSSQELTTAWREIRIDIAQYLQLEGEATHPTGLARTVGADEGRRTHLFAIGSLFGAEVCGGSSSKHD